MRVTYGLEDKLVERRKEERRVPLNIHLLELVISHNQLLIQEQKGYRNSSSQLFHLWRQNVIYDDYYYYHI